MQNIEGFFPCPGKQSVVSLFAQVVIQSESDIDFVFDHKDNMGL